MWFTLTIGTRFLTLQILSVFCSPVPLQHFIFPSASEGLYLVVDEKGKFREDNFQRAMSALHPANELETEKGKKKKKTNQGLESDLFKIIR